LSFKIVLGYGWQFTVYGCLNHKAAKHPSEIRSAVFFKEFHGAGPSEIRSAVTIVNFTGQAKKKFNVRRVERRTLMF